MKIKVFLYLGLLATTAVWGGAFLVMKDSLVRQDVYSFLASRFILAAAFMFIYKPKSLTGLDRKFVKRAILIGIRVKVVLLLHQLRGRNLRHHRFLKRLESNQPLFNLKWVTESRMTLLAWAL